MKIGPPVCIAPTADVCGEGIVWVAAENAVYWTDINRFLIHRYDAADKSVKTWFFAEPVTAISLTTDDNTFAVVLGSRLILWSPAKDERRDFGFAIPGWPQVRGNDARSDSRGSLWIGTMSNNVHPDGSPGEVIGKQGALYRVDPDGTVTEWKRDIGVSNTMVWNPQHTAFYTSDTPANQLFQFDYDAQTGNVSNERIFLADFPRGLPDGSAMDAEGYLWSCRWGGNCIVRVAPDGKVDQVIEIPVKNVTTCTFGGPDLTTLYVTTAGVGSRTGDQLAGGLFTLETDIQGQAENRFSLHAAPRP